MLVKAAAEIAKAMKLLSEIAKTGHYSVSHSSPFSPKNTKHSHFIIEQCGIDIPSMKFDISLKRNKKRLDYECSKYCQFCCRSFKVGQQMCRRMS
jgi:hypothetical protein